MMLRTKSLLGLMLVGFMGVATAATTDLGTLGGAVSVGNSFGPAAIINDMYIFDIASPSAAVGTLVTINFDIPVFPGPEFAIENFTVSFLDNLNQLITSDTQTSLSDNVVSISANLPSALDYQFTITGNVIGSLGGSYGGVLAAVATAPVPEADAYAMMLAGLGLIGFMVSRRRNA